MKKLISILLTAALILSLTACGTGSASAPTDPAQRPEVLVPLAAAVSHPFADIPADAAYSEAVAWCYENGFLSGTSDTTFDPDADLTRSMLASVIYRAAGKPEVSGVPAFSDTQADTWYSNAVVWASDQGIIQGYGNGFFGTADPVSVEQLQVILDRYLGKGDTWKGDPALAYPATRAQVAAALYENLKDSSNGGKVLVAYFSRTGENYGVGVIENGNTEIVAEMIAAGTGADLFHIETVNAYPSGYQECTEVAQTEKNDNADICLEIARKGAVLLKNEDNTLPLTEKDYIGDNSVALIGLGAENLLSGAGQERSYGRISRMKSPAKALRDLLGENANLESAVAVDLFGKTIPADCLYQDEACTQPGLIRSYGVPECEDEPSPYAAMMMLDMAGPEDNENSPSGDGPAMDMGGGKEFKGVASADNADDSDMPAFMPELISDLVGDMEGHETGSFCTVDELVEFTCGTSDGKINQNYKNAADGTAFTKGECYTWNGYLKVPSDGEYTLILQAIGGHTAFRINLDGEKFTSIGSTETREGAQWPWGSPVATAEGMEVHGKSFVLEAGKAYPIKLCANARIKHKDLQVRLSWITPEQRKADYDKAIALAAKAQKVFYFLSEDYCFRTAGISGVTFNMSELTSLDIPQEQADLIRDIKAAMRPDAKLILMHNYGQIYALGDVEPMCDAIMNIWTPGQEGGKAVAELLTGAVNPSGKLAITMPKKDTDTLVSDTPEHRTTRYESYVKDGKKLVDFDEGIFFGYRWYDKQGVAPLYAFGHGLSYTSFDYSDLSVSGANVTFTVTNTGAVPGTEIAQVYLGAGEVPAGVQMAAKALCGFARLENLQPGESRTVTVSIPERSFCYWNASGEPVARADGTKDKWVRTEGKRKVWVGAASDELILEGEVS